MTTIFIFTHFGLNICHPFLYVATLKGFVFIIGKLVCDAQTACKIEKPTWQIIIQFYKVQMPLYVSIILFLMNW